MMMTQIPGVETPGYYVDHPVGVFKMEILFQYITGFDCRIIFRNLTWVSTDQVKNEDRIKFEMRWMKTATLSIKNINTCSIFGRQ